MHTRLRAASALLAAVLLTPVLLGLAPVRASAAPETDAQRGAAALRFLRAAQAPDGSLDASIGETADFVIGAAALGYDPGTLVACSGRGALDFIAASSDAAATDAGKTAKAVLAAVAAGKDPRAFHGRDLVGRLEKLHRASTGAYGDGGTFSQSLAIAALHAAGRPVPAAAVTRLLSLQDADGSWNYQAAANSTAGDSNSTAIALMALAAVGDHTADAKALAFLHTQQLPDGGFAYQSPSPFGPAISDPNSDGLAIQAIRAAGEGPTAVGWSKGTKNALTHLGGSQDASGGFGYPGTKPNAFTTSQLPAALAGVPYGAAVRFTPGATIDGPNCEAAPSSSPRPSATAPASAAAATPRSTPPATSGEPAATRDGSGAFLGLVPLLVLAFALVLAARRGPSGRRP